MSEENSGSPFKATSQHEFLARQEGTWDVDCSYTMGPDTEPMEVSGVERAEMLGPFWLVTRLEVDLLGSPLTGQASTGYDPARKLFVGIWQDSSNPFLYSFEGFLDKDQTTLKLSGENYDPMRGVRAIYRSVIDYISDDEKKLTLSVELADGDVSTILEYHYTRR